MILSDKEYSGIRITWCSNVYRNDIELGLLQVVPAEKQML